MVYVNGAQKEFWAGKNVLITGIGGFVATYLAASLSNAGANIVGIMRDSAGERRLQMFGLEGRVDIVRGSIEDYALVERAFSEYEVEYCFHLAAQAIVGVANRSPLSTFESNIRGTWTVLEAARQSQLLKGMVVASSDKAYGDQDVLPYTEDTPLQAVYPYDLSKLCAETIARGYSATWDVPIAIVRCANIYGGGDLNWSRIVPGTIRSMLQGEAPVIRSDGTLERDYLFVTDAVSAYATLAEQLHHEDVCGEAFNFGWGHGHSVNELVETILKQGNSSLRPTVLGQSNGEIKRQWLASDKAKKILGWEPTVDLDTGIRRSIDWYQQHLTGATEPNRVLVGS
jgi:CDP-glucose 4,6-dehydratase